MKKINIVSSSFPPEVSGGANRVHSISQMFDHNGYSVHLITLGNEAQTQEIGNHTTVNYLYRRDFSKVNFVKRAFHEIYYAYKLAKISKQFKSDATVVSIPYMFLLPIYALFGNPKESIIDIRDLVWEYLPDRGLYGFLKKIIAWVMYRSIKRFKAVSVTNEHEKRTIQHFTQNKNITIIPNGITQEKFNLFSQIEPQKREKCRIAYVGYIGIAQNLITLLKAVERLNDENIEVHFAGSGNREEMLKAYAQEHQMDNVIFHGMLPWQELKAIYEETTILYAQLGKSYNSAVPSKLYEYGATGLPIIYGGIGQAKTFVEQLENSICVEPGDVEALMEAIHSFKAISFKKSLKNQQFIKENFVREIVNLKFLNLIESQEIIGGKQDKILSFK